MALFLFVKEIKWKEDAQKKKISPRRFGLIFELYTLILQEYGQLFSWYIPLFNWRFIKRAVEVLKQLERGEVSLIFSLLFA